ncbi:redoxin domain-containing protein [Novipirellula caenicola]|uniref:Thioredoxin domain-containing protein n=1 Tax=Novipirellula caenicola TaxID=1536901 RepID=A0ABP9VPT4_9BACT
MNLRYFAAIPLLCCLCITSQLWALEPSAGGDHDESSTTAGHSFHGEAFNEGPRQQAVLIPGIPKIDFPTSTKSERAQQFFEQGVAQLHGFWYLEAERSFRQAAKEDPEMAIAYWGMAMANVNNRERARGLIDEGVAKKDKGADQREKLYIDALNRYLPKFGEDAPKDDSDAKKKRAEKFIADLEKILHAYPDDIEAKAFLVLQIWLSDREGVKLTSRYAVNALLSEIFAVDPMHPAHHYRIHLWDSAQPKLALESAANCGPSMPGVAHMWHMPGHIYSKLHRYADAAWQQEASARVDHAHMTRARLMPDQIHNFAHNNEWLTRNLIHIGRVRDAIDQAQNLVSLPQHPKYNTLDKRGSYKYGRERLLQVLTQFALWDELIKESGGYYLPPTSDAAQQEEWLGWLAVAHFRTGDAARGAKTLRSLNRRRIALETKLLDLADAAAAAKEAETNKSEPQQSEEKSEADADESETQETPDQIKSHLKTLRTIIARAAAAAASHRREEAKFKEHAKHAKLEPLIEARWLADARDLKGALEIAKREYKKRTGEVRPLAILVDLLWRNEQKEEAIKQFQELRNVAADADIDTPLLSRLSHIAKAAGVQGDWRIPREPAADLGDRPPLDELGPFRWQTYEAPTWEAKLPDGSLTSAEEFSGRPRIVIFYLGFGCLHCMEQLHAMSPRVNEFRKAGIDIVAISTEDPETLKTGIDDFDKPIEIPLLADAQHHIFKSYRCWDDFENQPLHGTFLIDSRDRVRWQDIGYEPFMDVDFLLEESQRLLKLP